MWAVEAVFIGHLSAAALGGVGLALQIIITTFTVIMTMVVGASLIIARHLGAKEFKQADHMLGQTIAIGIVLSILISLFWYLGAIEFFRFIKESTPVARENGVDYLRTVSYFGPFIILNFIMMGVIRGTGDTIYSMFVNVLINLLNLIFAPLLIFGRAGFPRLEVEGAAIAVGISHTVGFLVTCFLLRSGWLSIYLSFKEIASPNWNSFKRLFKTGFPTTIEQLAWAFGQLIVSTFAARIGVVALATHQILLRVNAVISMSYQGFAIGAMTIISKQIGAGQKSLVKQVAKDAMKITLGFVVIVALILPIYSKEILILFTPDPAVTEMGLFMIYIFAVVQIPKALNIVMIGNLRGVGQLQWLMWGTIFSVIAFEFMSAYAAVFFFNLALLGIWIALGLDESARLIANTWRFKVAKWKKF